jgi:hypothetical protein
MLAVTTRPRRKRAIGTPEMRRWVRRKEVRRGWARAVWRAAVRVCSDGRMWVRVLVRRVVSWVVRGVVEGGSVVVFWWWWWLLLVSPLVAVVDLRLSAEWWDGLEGVSIVG